MTDLKKLKQGLITAHDSLIDVLEAEYGDGIHALTLSDFSEIEATARYLRELIEKLPPGAAE